MNELNYSSIKRKIESKLCNEHRTHPQFIKTSKGFEIKACCDKFRNELVKESEKFIGEETQKAIEKMMKNILKK